MAHIQKSLIVKTLKAHGVNQLDVVADMRAHGSHISRTALLDLIRYGLWPKKINPESIRESFTRLLGEDNQEEIKEMLKTAPRIVNATSAYQVLPLLAKYELSQADLLRAMKKTGITLSASALSQLLRHGKWPILIEGEQIKAAVEKFMSDHISTHELSTMWNETETKKGKATKTKTPSKPTLIFEQPEREMLNQRTMQHFKLSRHPFQNEIHCVEDLFMSQQNRRIRESMVQASQNGSILAIIAECGAGKSEMRKCFYDYVNKNYPDLVVIEPTVINKKRLTSEMIFDAIAEELNITSMPNGLEKRSSKVRRTLINSSKARRKHVLIIEEAHLLSDDVFKQLKSISELDDGFNRLVSVILIGQTELQGKLSLTNLKIREFSLRCNVMTMQPLGIELTNYIDHKFARCNVDYKKVIEPDAIKAIKNRLEGVMDYGQINRSNDVKDMTYPLIVNTLLVTAMNEAASACEEIITAELIGEIK